MRTERESAPKLLELLDEPDPSLYRRLLRDARRSHRCPVLLNDGTVDRCDLEVVDENPALVDIDPYTVLSDWWARPCLPDCPCDEAPRGELAGTDEQKTVQVFPAPGGQLALLCGGPRFSTAPTWGYRHLLWRHKTDFDGAAAGTSQNWRDVADLAMRTIAADPDATYPARGDQTCRSRVLFLKDLRTNQVVRQVIFTMYSQNGGNRINTVFPSNRQCGPS